MFSSITCVDMLNIKASIKGEQELIRMLKSPPSKDRSSNLSLITELGRIYNRF